MTLWGINRNSTKTDRRTRVSLRLQRWHKFFYLLLFWSWLKRFVFMKFHQNIEESFAKVTRSNLRPKLAIFGVFHYSFVKVHYAHFFRRQKPLQKHAYRIKTLAGKNKCPVYSDRYATVLRPPKCLTGIYASMGLSKYGMENFWNRNNTKVLL